MIRIDTTQYQASHGRKPRQHRQYRVSPWAFLIDTNPTPVCITGSYADAVVQAKARAQYSITVLP